MFSNYSIPVQNTDNRKTKLPGLLSLEKSAEMTDRVEGTAKVQRSPSLKSNLIRYPRRLVPLQIIVLFL